MNIFPVVWLIFKEGRALASKFVLIIVAAIAFTSSQQAFAVGAVLIGTGYSLNSYDYSDSTTDSANALSSRLSAELGGKDGVDTFIVAFVPVLLGRFGFEFGELKYQFSNSYKGTDNSHLTKKIVGTASYFNITYALAAWESSFFYAKAGINSSASSLSITSTDPVLSQGNGDDKSFGYGYGAGLVFSPSSSTRFNLIVKLDNFGTVVQGYDNDSSAWGSDGKLLSSGDLDLSTITIGFAYNTL